MNIDALSIKDLGKLEQQVTELLTTMRKTKLTNEPIYVLLQSFMQQLGEVRRQRFDADNTEYSGY